MTLEFTLNCTFGSLWSMLILRTWMWSNVSSSWS